MQYLIVIIILVFIVPLIISTKLTRRKLVKSYHMEKEPLKSKKFQDLYMMEQELNESDVQKKTKL